MRRIWKIGQRYVVPGVYLCLLLFLSACQNGSHVSVRSPTPTGTARGSAINLASQPTVLSTSTPTPTPDPASQAFPSGPVPSGSGTIPSALPHSFSFGIIGEDTALLDQQRSQNGTAYAFRYQYLVHGWDTWNQPTGAFATYFMQGTAQHGYIPAFVYYVIRNTPGPLGVAGDDLKQDQANLADPTVMNAYYANWALLLQKVGAFGKPVLIIVEPDLWGFLQSIAEGKGSTNAASVPASVASSGSPDAAGYPDTAQGFAWTLLHIRDKYAPNAILAQHASPWSAQRPGIDVAGMAQREANFLTSAGMVDNPAGVSTWDLLSNDIADRDAGRPDSGTGSWWDRYNRTLPNFARYLSFMSLLNQDTHRRIIMWQVPVGNQYFETMNNTSGHYQDNKAEYILGHVPDFAAAGIIGVLFGSGQAYGAAISDSMNDGVTNPAPVSTYECDGCNTHVSSYPDDDGGYLRIFIGAYMKNPVMLS